MAGTPGEPASKPRVAYVMSHYPAISHAFVAREIGAARAAGLPLATLSIHRAQESSLLAEEDRREAAATIAVLPVRPHRLCGAHLRALLRSPRRYLSTLLLALRDSGGARERLWRLFYFAEAIVLWDRCARVGIRHLHAQFADVATDVAMLVAHYGGSRHGERWSWSLTVHGSVEFYNVRKYRLAEKLRRARFALAISDFGRSQLMTLSEPVQWPAIRVVRCGVDPDVYLPPSDRDSRRQGEPEILFVGRLLTGKGLSLLFEAVAALRSEGLQLRISIVGDGPARELYESSARALGLHEQVTFHGAVGQDDIRDHYSRADIFCLPSLAEGIPVVLMEAMAMELAVISTRIMGIPELVDDERNGLLVTPGRADVLRDALRRLVESPQLRRELGRAARSKVTSEFDVRDSGRRLHEIFLAELGEDGSGARG